MSKLFIILIMSIAITGCHIDALFSSIEEREPEPGIRVCIIGDTTPHYFVGDFDQDGTTDSSRIMLHRCWGE